ncbi:MAG: hypothetical protein E6J90_39120 [Deltaproteobacteria bacterium]|nr:MAG: hypothetical protein E6J90_39120 [Deltaproteobacteria bacterium]
MPPRQLRGDVPPELDAAIMAALAKEPSARPRSATAFRAAMTGVVVCSADEGGRAKRTRQR